MLAPIAGSRRNGKPSFRTLTRYLTEAQRRQKLFGELQTLQGEIHRRTGHVGYLIDGRKALLDAGQTIWLLDKREATVLAGLEVALQKFGPLLEVTGTCSRFINWRCRRASGAAWTEEFWNAVTSSVSVIANTASNWLRNPGPTVLKGLFTLGMPTEA